MLTIISFQNSWILFYIIYNSLICIKTNIIMSVHPAIIIHPTIFVIFVFLLPF
jgi:hypothetical protein